MDEQSLDPLVGRTFGDRYYIDSLLGSGGMGSVYLALDEAQKDMRIAIKILHASLSRNDKHVKRFLREVQITRKISHPNVVRIFDVGQHKGQLFFTMEYVEGISVKEKLAQRRFTVDETLRILQEVCCGLDAIHQGGIIHRDLKPANILLTLEESVKIADFGVARPVQSDITAPYEVVGSVGYMSPELWRCEDVDATADIYSLGVMLYEMVTGFRPFDGESSTEVMNRHLSDIPQTPVSDIVEIPTWLTALILMMLEKEPMKRPQSANEVLSIIQSATHGARLQYPHAAGDARPSSDLSTPISDQSLAATKKTTRPKNGEIAGASAKVKQGVIDRNPITSTRNRIVPSMKGQASKKDRSQDRGKPLSEIDLFPKVHNPASGLALALIAGVLLSFILIGPSTLLFKDMIGDQAIENLSIGFVSFLYGVLAMGVSLLVAIPSLLFGAAISSLSGQILSFVKCALLALGAAFCLFAVHLADFIMSSGVKTSNLLALQIGDIGNAALINLIEGAFFLPTPTGFESRLVFPAPRLLTASTTQPVLIVKYFIGVLLFYVCLIISLKAVSNSRKGSLLQVNYYFPFGAGLGMLIAGYIFRPAIIERLPFDAKIPVAFSAGCFSLNLETFSLIWGSVTWLTVISVFLISLAQAYRRALNERARQLQKLRKGLDPSKQIVGKAAPLA